MPWSRNHERERPYACQICPSRFKNNYHATRHQNSVHFRHYSWSCGAIPSLDATFRPSILPTSQRPTDPAITPCSYCGKEFPQSDWANRLDHLINIHKVGLCDQSKKFYREDHFRQHLKHCHAGKIGKWVVFLEELCMRTEAPAVPEPLFFMGAC